MGALLCHWKTTVSQVEVGVLGGLGWPKAFEAECLLVLLAWPANNTRPPSPIRSSVSSLLQICQIPADDFVGEQNPLHLRVFDMVAPLILDNLKKGLFSFLYIYMYKKLPYPVSVLFAPSLWP